LNFDVLGSESDRCVELRDDLAGIVSMQCADASPLSIAASIQVGPYSSCGSFEVDGVVTSHGMDSGQQVERSYRVDVQVACGSGCTRGTGYWKSHAPAGPPPYDATWESLPQRGETEFLDSGMTYVEVLWSSRSGNAWMHLAKPWIAAQLNQLAGADPSVIAAEFAEAEQLLREAEIGGPFSLAEESRMAELAAHLERWNSGEIGPGECPALPSE
jgi:hypothetical protein